MTASAISTLEQLFIAETALMHEFISALQAESDVLADPAQAESLHATTGRKTALAQQLSQAASRRHAVYTELGYPGQETSHTVLRRQHPNLSPFVDALAQSAQQAHQLNEENGIAIELYLKHSQQALNDLQAIAGQDLPLYDATGRARQHGGTKTSIKA